MNLLKCGMIKNSLNVSCDRNLLIEKLKFCVIFFNNLVLNQSNRNVAIKKMVKKNPLLPINLCYLPSCETGETWKQRSLIAAKWMRGRPEKESNLLSCSSPVI